ncbi:MAG: nucleoside deaminase [Candidatus Actinomarina sp.]|tara:strand:+ start:1966 stop:2424 length:459 start_codon:yes stop_codon:yes gene_type:complete
MNYQSDTEKMQVALEQARIAYDKDEIPVGAALFNEKNELVAANHNRRELDQDPTAHAEILTLKSASEIYKSWRLEKTTLVVTLEPDPMCAGAIVNARIKRLVYGAPNEKAGAAWTLYNIPQDKRLNHYTEITDGILRKESEELLTSFFEHKR